MPHMTAVKKPLRECVNMEMEAAVTITSVMRVKAIVTMTISALEIWCVARTTALLTLVGRRTSSMMLGTIHPRMTAVQKRNEWLNATEGHLGPTDQPVMSVDKRSLQSETIIKIWPYIQQTVC